MNKQHRSTRAILVLECPWEVDELDSNRASVLPFVEGIAKYAGDTEVYHADFYDKSSFGKALNCLCRSRADNTLIYIAAHGFKNKIQGASIADLMLEVGMHSTECNITGIMLGSCYVGQQTSTMEAFIEGTFLKWCAGYSSSCEWMAGTLIDCAILAAMLELDKDDFSNKSLMIEELASALGPFSKNYIIGEGYKGESVTLEDSITFVVQPSGRGNRACTVTEDVLDVYEGFQKYD